MASPFKFFRTHQTQLLVVIGILTMVAFIILPSVLQQLEVVSRTRTTSNVVETKKYGNLSTFDVQRMQNRQNVLIGFFSQIYRAYEAKINNMAQEQNQASLMKLRMNYINALNHLRQVSDDSRSTVVNLWLLENKAREMGISVNDAYINAFITECTEGLDDETVSKIIYGDKSQNTRAIEDSLFNALNGYLLCEKYKQALGLTWDVFLTGERINRFCWGVNTTADKINSFERLNRVANAEFFPVKVEDFVSEVAEPSEKEVEKFFEQYKDKDALMDSSEPGLRQPQKVTLEYCYGSYEAFMDPTSVTDEQIQKYYDENKETKYRIEKDDKKKENKLGELPNIGLADALGDQYRPLDDELKEEIRQSLASVAATEQLRNAIGSIQKQMDDYSNAVDIYEMNAEVDKNAVAPEKIDLKALAEANKLKYVNTGLISLHAFADPDSQLAQLRLEDASGVVYASNVFFGDAPMLLKSKVFTNSSGELFVVWKSENVEEHTPTFTEEGVKQQAIDQIKYIAARKLAEEKAKQLTEKAVKDQLPLKSCLGEDAFVPPQFTWLVYGPVFNPYSIQRPIYVSPIEKVQDGGYDFMSELFEMKPGEIKSIANSSKSVYYVVRMIDLTPTDQLYARFCVTREFEYFQARDIDMRFFYNDLFDSLANEAGLKWLVRPDDKEPRE